MRCTLASTWLALGLNLMCAHAAADSTDSARLQVSATVVASCELRVPSSAALTGEGSEPLLSCAGALSPRIERTVSRSERLGAVALTVVQF